ncbi:MULTISPECIES: hypothetical protein [unclassified Mycoplasma]|uniref:hypothetical protein n=1 Tax=unclassified Mycoplasma TaxID=2683645 RepID=UPI00211BE782|nr:MULTISPECIES: hypothetical protein [unclassified Mycoplasma]UUM19897.1 hypothetical protein NPA11_00445 [Mycoplasma sp. 1578d]UUM24877.1 hypothetical protein NPA12_00425 [Mycoplasma sp. 3686d]
MTTKKLSKGKLSKDMIILITLLTVAISLLITGIVLVVLGSGDYLKFVENSSAQIQISQFIYGLFSLILSVLLFILTGLFANSRFNKKLNKNE